MGQGDAHAGSISAQTDRMKFSKQITLLVFLFSGGLVTAQAPVLNELLASNESGIRDED